MALNRRVEVHFIYDTEREMQESLATISSYSGDSNKYLSAHDSIEVSSSPDAKYVRIGELAKLENIAAKACIEDCGGLKSIDGPVVIESYAVNTTIEQAIESHIKTENIGALTALAANKSNVNGNSVLSSNNYASIKSEVKQNVVKKPTTADKVMVTENDFKAKKDKYTREARSV